MENLNLTDIIQQDVIRNKEHSMSGLQTFKFFLMEKYHPLRFIIAFRIVSNCNRGGVYSLIRRMYYHCAFRFGYEISPSTKIGPGLRLPHWAGGIVIHNNAIIGENCEIMQGVTIGNNALKSRYNVAIIGDNVTLCAGCKIIGNVKIGNNVIVGANAVVTKDIPDNAVVVGAPAHIIRYQNVD